MSSLGHTMAVWSSAYRSTKGRGSIGDSSWRRWMLLPLLMLALTLGGCGGGSSGEQTNTLSQTQGCNSSTCGNVYVSMTDADGDFLSYTVDVVSLTLKKANGDVVETLPARTRVDFAQLVDMTEFVTAATIPNGAYVQGTIRLDYTDADVTVEKNGQATAAKIVDKNGQALGTIDLNIMLDNRNYIVIAPGIPAMLQLDFDLAATHTVDLTKTPVQAVAEPLIVATVEPVDSKEMRTRGPLVNVDLNASTYMIDVRPFNHPSVRLGRFVVRTNSNTEYEIDGQTYGGNDGLRALAQKPAGTMTAAFGTLQRSPREFVAARVHAGTSVPGQNFDALWGTVTSRTGDTLTVRGGTVSNRSGAVYFERRDFTLLVGPNTVVTRDGRHGNPLTEDALSVGQRIHAFGTLDNSTTTGPVLNATAGRVRMHLTPVWGMLKSAVPGLLTLDVDSIDGRRIEIFNFSGTGTAPAMDADPDNYEVSTGVLNLDSFAVNAPTRVYGFVTPFGLAPPDFEARTAVDIANVRAILGIGWGLNGTSAPFTRIDATGIVISTANPDIGLRHHIALGPHLLDIKSLPMAPTIVPMGERGLYAIGERLRIEVFANFAEFTARLSEKLGGGSKAVTMTVSGSYDGDTATLNAREIHVNLTRVN